MLTKVCYVGVSIEDLIEIYCLWIRSVAEYNSVLFHDSLTIEESNSLEKIQVLSLKIILQDNYIIYLAALEMCSLETLFLHREKQTFNLGKNVYSTQI